MALWRVNALIEYRTVAARTAFVNDYQAWRVGRSSLLIERHQILSVGDEPDENGVPQVTQPTTRSDLVFSADADNDAIYDWIRNRSATGLNRIFLSAHRCRFTPGGSDIVRYFEWRR